MAMGRAEPCHQTAVVALAQLVRVLVPARSKPAATHVVGAVSVLGAALAFSTLGSLSGIAYRAGMGSPTFVALRALVGAGLLAGLLARQPERLVRLRSLPLREQVVLAAAIGANACLNLVLFAAYGQMAVALVLALYFTYPLLVAVGSVALGRERFTVCRTCGLLLAGAGLALVMGNQVTGTALAPLGIVFALAAATCQASYLVLSRASFTRVPAEQVTALMLGGGAVLAGAVAVAVDLPTGHLLAWTSSASAWIAVAVAGALGAAAAKVWLLRGVRLLGATRTAVLMLAEPVGGVILAAILLGQGITPMEAAGGAIILAAAWLVQRPAPGRHPPAAVLPAR
jgi:drug/metabolite transporter (DMT)-like permease